MVCDGPFIAGLRKSGRWGLPHLYADRGAWPPFERGSMSQNSMRRLSFFLLMGVTLYVSFGLAG
ncbi:MAG: hypothetical protein DI498_00345 [Paracoccus denitrificans]|nr:MAG: hypothetical protein DI498_00345 [Paracoccus denitrificans]PZO86219.1 MAG: hypothetical protein DI633_00345 [Paracoccus denitrificans]